MNVSGLILLALLALEWLHDRQWPHRTKHRTKGLLVHAHTPGFGRAPVATAPGSLIVAGHDQWVHRQPYAAWSPSLILERWPENTPVERMGEFRNHALGCGRVADHAF